jgi:hypothetical protein
MRFINGWTPLRGAWHYAAYFNTSNQPQEHSNIMSDTTNETTPVAEAHDEISYHAVEKNGQITAIWEMRGRKHVRTIDPRSAEGRHLLGHTDSQAAAAQA